ncbi:MAG: DUF3108 domain-containing protein [Prevotellaceae bacterium]|jgi:hypothetical protein|nr:DUF3108 domain-containing protein [Prevotellaceae bacterium]
MKLKTFLTAILALSFIFANAQENNEYAFKSSEKLQYDVFFNWGFIWITAAKVDFTVREITYNKTPAYRLKMAGKTVNTFGMFTFTDTVTTYVNKKTLKPYSSREASFEPDYYTISNLRYLDNDTDKWSVTVEQERKKGTKYDTITSNKLAYYDLLTTLYNLRNANTDDWELNHKMSMPMIFGKDTFNLYLRYVGKDKITLKSGKSYNCLKIRPLLAEGKLFEKGEGMTIWISDDKNHIPLAIESKLKVGYIKAQVTGISGNGHPMAEVVKKK